MTGGKVAAPIVNRYLDRLCTGNRYAQPQAPVRTPAGLSRRRSERDPYQSGFARRRKAAMIVRRTYRTPRLRRLGRLRTRTRFSF